MAFGITRAEMNAWKDQVSRGEIAFLTHFWLDLRFPQFNSVTKVGCNDLAKLSNWCALHGLDPRYIHHRHDFPHFDLLGSKQREILMLEQRWDQLERFGLI